MIHNWSANACWSVKALALALVLKTNIVHFLNLNRLQLFYEMCLPMLLKQTSKDCSRKLHLLYPIATVEL